MLGWWPSAGFGLTISGVIGGLCGRAGRTEGKEEVDMWRDHLEKVEKERKDKELLLFALSTCGWCKRAREFLDGHGFSYEYVYVDLLEGQDREEALQEVSRWNPRKSFPTLVIDGDHVLAGFNEERYKELLLG